MADFSAAAPVEPVKQGDYLHDRSRIPAMPEITPRGEFDSYFGYGLGVLLALGALALMFQTRASWERHREWVVPATAPITAIAGLALGHMIARRKWKAAAPALGCLAVAMIFTAFNAWRGAVVDGHDAGRNTMSVFAGIFMALFMACAIVGAVVVEARDPVRPPAPEV